MSVIMFDMDGVLAHFTLGFRQLANKRYGLPIWTNAEQATWEMPDLSKEQKNALWREIEASPAFWQSLESLATLEERVRIRDLGQRHDLYFVTARLGPTAKRQTERWLQWKLVAMAPTVLVVRDFRKGAIARALRAEYAIDDKPECVADILGHAPETWVAVRDWQYNRWIEGKTVMMGRVSSVTEFLNEIEKREGEKEKEMKRAA